jgi:hypothetical protein
MKSSVGTPHVFLAVLFLGIFTMAARNATDPDIWWHLKTGQYISEHKSVPRTDAFSFTRGGQPWIAHEWLTELFLYELQRGVGFGGLIMTFAAVIPAAFFLLYLRCGPAPYIAGITTLWAAFATRPLWGVRPQVLSLLLTSLWLLLLERSDHRPRLLWWTVPLTLLWVNLHAGFALGLGLSALFLVGEWIERAHDSAAENSFHLRTAAFVLLVDLLIVPLNPNGVQLFTYPIETLRSHAMQKYIAEWASPNFHHAEHWPFLFLILVTLAVFSWSRHPLRPRELLLLLVSLYAALCSVRMVPFFALIAAPVVSKRLGTWPKSSVAQPTVVRHTMNGAIVVAMVLFASTHAFHVIQHQPQTEAQRFPSQAVAFLAAHPPGTIFNHYDWGGYLIWRLYPSTRVFIDGRADLYGQELLDQFADAYQFESEWQKTLQAWNITTVIVPPASALATGLRNSRNWIVSYEDAQGIVFSSRPATADAPSTPANLARAIP